MGAAGAWVCTALGEARSPPCDFSCCPVTRSGHGDTFPACAARPSGDPGVPPPLARRLAPGPSFVEQSLTAWEGPPLCCWTASCAPAPAGPATASRAAGGTFPSAQSSQRAWLGFPTPRGQRWPDPRQGPVPGGCSWQALDPTPSDAQRCPLVSGSLWAQARG